MKIRFNLLPEKQKKHLHTQKVFRIVMEREIYVLILLMFLILSLFAIYFVLKTEMSIMQGTKDEIVQREQYKEIAVMHENFSSVHKKMALVDQLKKEQISTSRFLIMLSENISQNVVINSVVADENKVVIKAIADTREDVVAMKEEFRNIKYNDVQCFSDIVVPESELTAPVDVTFTMTSKVNLECFK
ncbi:MAG: hypothetical protein U9Q12_02815 [Patescibacteria group bacterium]|nr:hypothetical protein [Patescibacteria group bacterium]